MSLISATAVYKLGPTGALTTLPGVQFGKNVDVTYDDNAVKHVTLAGKRLQDILGPEKRTWKFAWSYLTLSEVNAIKSAIDQGRSAALYLIDPFQSTTTEIWVIVDSYRIIYITPYEADFSLTVMEV